VKVAPEMLRVCAISVTGDGCSRNVSCLYY
jgi:hypothetical protein